jgi:hypothetical protein
MLAASANSNANQQHQSKENGGRGT